MISIRSPLLRRASRVLALAAMLTHMEAGAYLQRPAYFNGKVHRLLPPPAGSSAATWGQHDGFAGVEERLLPYAQIVYPMQLTRVRAWVRVNVTFVYLARRGIRRVFVRLHCGDTRQLRQPWGEFDVLYDELTGRPKPLLGSLPIQMTPAVVSIALIFHEVGALHGRDVTASLQLAAVDACFVDVFQKLWSASTPLGELVYFSVFDRGISTGIAVNGEPWQSCSAPLHGCGGHYDHFAVRVPRDAVPHLCRDGAHP
jgi:hypothetical protein